MRVGDPDTSLYLEQESNFLRDQSGMKRQLSTLQQLIGVMDPELYAHLGQHMRIQSKLCADLSQNVQTP